MQAIDQRIDVGVADLGAVYLHAGIDIDPADLGHDIPLVGNLDHHATLGGETERVADLGVGASQCAMLLLIERQGVDRKSTRLNSSNLCAPRIPSSSRLHRLL